MTGAGAATAGPRAAAAPAGPAVAVEPGAREPVLAEIAAVAGAVAEERTRRVYADLAAAVEGGEVATSLLEPLQRVLEMSLATGRARRLHGPADEAAMLRLFFHTPAGAALRRSAEAASSALAGLAGHRLAGLAVTAKAPGIFQLQLDTDRCQLTLEVSRDGVEVAGLGVEI